MSGGVGHGPNQSRDTGRKKNAGWTPGQRCWLGVLLGTQHCILTHTPSINQGSKARNEGSWQGWAESEPRVVETSNKCLWTWKSVEARSGGWLHWLKGLGGRTAHPPEAQGTGSLAGYTAFLGSELTGGWGGDTLDLHSCVCQPFGTASGLASGAFIWFVYPFKARGNLPSPPPCQPLITQGWP